MRFTQIFSQDNALNLSGILVLMIVGVLSVYVVSDTALWPLVAMLSIGNLVTFVPFISDWGPQSRTQLRALLWLQAILIVSLYFMVSVSFIAILSIIWIV